jgi:hypothetical protein
MRTRKSDRPAPRRPTPLPRRLWMGVLGFVVFGVTAVVVLLLDEPPMTVWVIGSAAAFGAVVCLIDAVIVFVRMEEGESTAP